jgi:hypothetical protein
MAGNSSKHGDVKSGKPCANFLFCQVYMYTLGTTNLAALTLIILFSEMLEFSPPKKSNQIKSDTTPKSREGRILNLQSIKAT